MDTQTLASKLKQKLDSKTKPPGSLGELERLAEQIGLLQQMLTPLMSTCELFLFAADHGMAQAGVSAYPQAVTRQMVLNFLEGGAAANVFAKELSIKMHIVDAGIAGAPIDDLNLIHCRIDAGTSNAIDEPAMTRSQLKKAMAMGQDLVQNSSADAIALGEMGIGNSASATLLIHKILNLPLSQLTGAGAGLDEPGIQRKLELVTKASQRTTTPLNPEEALIEYGGFEIAMMTGAMLAAAKMRKLMLVDGYIAGSSALCACQIDPKCRQAMIFAHQSAEKGHARLLTAMDAKPLLNLDMRLGEGTGALLAWPLVKCAAAMLNDMATFESASISGPQETIVETDK